MQHPLFATLRHPLFATLRHPLFATLRHPLFATLRHPLPSSGMQRRVSWCWLPMSQVYTSTPPSMVKPSGAVSNFEPAAQHHSRTASCLNYRTVRSVLGLQLCVCQSGSGGHCGGGSVNSVAFRLRKIHRRKFRSVLIIMLRRRNF
jgi:hypothetical protein